MESKYQKYYDNLNGKDFYSPISRYSTSLGNAKSKMISVESLMNSSLWQEKGLEIIKNSVIPTLNKQLDSIEEGITALSKVNGKIAELLGKLGELQNACNDYDTCEEEDKEKYRDKIRDKEREVDSKIDEINSISYEFSKTDLSVSSFITDIKQSKTEESSNNYVQTDYSRFSGDKKAFLGTMNDDSYYLDPVYTNKNTNHAKKLYAYDNTTGQVLSEGDKIYLKPGETRVLTVKLPNDAGHIDHIVRTTADDLNSSVVTTRSDVDPDPNNVQYVNYKNNHYPDDQDLLHTHYYDWIITADEKGVVQVSQTCEYKIQENSSTPKAMMDIVVVVDDDN